MAADPRFDVIYRVRPHRWPRTEADEALARTFAALGQPNQAVIDELNALSRPAGEPPLP